jgi:hypothetical protein
MMKGLELICFNENDVSSKYPQWGSEVRFKDSNGVEYYVVYANAKQQKFFFKEKQKYNLYAIVKKESLFQGHFRYKMERIKNVKEIA